MSVTHQVAKTWRNGSNQLAGTNSRTSDGEDNREITLTASQTNEQVDLTFTTANLRSIFILPSHNVKLYTNNPGGSSPDDTIQLYAGRVFEWQTETGIPIPFVGDSGAIDTIYFTNDAAAEATVSIRLLKNVTT